MAREECVLLAIPRTVAVSFSYGYGYNGARTDTTQQPVHTPDKELELKNITVYVSGYIETDTTGMLSPPTVWLFSVAM